MENKIPLTSDQIPYYYSRCFQSDCPLADLCTHYLAGKFVPAGCVEGEAVYPTARQGNTCRCFKEIRVIKAAYGFTALFAEVKHKDDTPLRDRIKAYLGNKSAFYRYHHGERLLSPKQQEWILALFRKYGYEENLHFDGYRDMYDFDL